MDNNQPRGRTFSISTVRSTSRIPSQKPSASGRNSSPASSGGSVKRKRRNSFTRSRSPPRSQMTSLSQASNSVRPPRQRPQAERLPRNILPSFLTCQLPIPLSSRCWQFQIDARLAGECSILLGSLYFAVSKLNTLFNLSLTLQQYNRGVSFGQASQRSPRHWYSRYLQNSTASVPHHFPTSSGRTLPFSR